MDEEIDGVILNCIWSSIDAKYLFLYVRSLWLTADSISIRPQAVCRQQRGPGASSDTNGPLAVAVISSLVSSTLLTLVLIPSVYWSLEHRISRFHKNVIQ